MAKPIAVRDGQQVAITCPECGCRFDVRELSNSSWENDGWSVSHFGDDEERDARGCICSLNSSVWIYHKGSYAQFF